MRRDDYYEMQNYLDLLRLAIEGGDLNEAMNWCDMAIKKLENMYTRKAGYGT